MTETCDIALKEWAVVCGALAAGVQRVLLRKGGIHEGPDGFVVEHNTFWLFPTGFHQSLDGVRPEFCEAAQGWMLTPPAANQIAIQHLCKVSNVRKIASEAELAGVRGEHILSDKLVLDRFHYRQPGIFLLEVETTSLAMPITIPNDPRYDGCRSWVRLNEPLPK